MVYSAMIEQMANNVVGYSSGVALLVLGIFSYLCFKRRFGFTETLYVLLPVVIGITTSNYLEPFVQGLFIMAIGAIWGYAVTKTFNALDTFSKIYIVFFMMSMALTVSQYAIGDIVLKGNATPLNMTSIAETTSVSSSTNWLGIQIAYDIANMFFFALNFLLCGGIFAWLSAAGLPVMARYMGYGIIVLGILSGLPLLMILLNIVKTSAEIVLSFPSAVFRLIRP